MAKKKTRSYEPTPARTSTPTVAATRPVAGDSSLFTIKQYAIMNAIFDGFCILQLIIVQVVIRETRGLYFFFGLLMVGFLAVSIFDYLYDRHVRSPEEPAA